MKIQWTLKGKPKPHQHTTFGLELPRRPASPLSCRLLRDRVGINVLNNAPRMRQKSLGRGVALNKRGPVPLQGDLGTFFLFEELSFSGFGREANRTAILEVHLNGETHHLSGTPNQKRRCF